MRIVHARSKVFAKDHAFENKFSVLVWILALLKWKEFGHSLVLYTDEFVLNKIKEFKFEHLYDEINTSLLEDKDKTKYKNLDFYLYWAMPKLIALWYEKLELNNDVVITDQDVVPMQDWSRFWKSADVTVWSNKEFTEFKATYPALFALSTPENYIFPKWIRGEAKPLNTGVLHIRDPKVVKFYLEAAFGIALNNKNTKNNTNCQTMCNAEQRFLGEVISYKRLSYNTIQPIDKGLFNKNGFHTHGYKAFILNKNGLQWHLNLLLMIKKLDEKMFESLLNHPKFKEEKNYFKENGYTCEVVSELQQYLK